MLTPELRQKITDALKKQDGFGNWYEYYDDDHDDYDFFGAAMVNWKVFLITILYLKLEKDGEIPVFSDSLEISDETKYTFVPLVTGDTAVYDIPMCTLIKKCMLEAGFEFPYRYNFISSDNSWARYQSVYSPEADTSYSIHGDELGDLDLELVLHALDSHFDVMGEIPDPDTARALEFLKGAYKVEKGVETEYLSSIRAMTEDELQASELTYDGALEDVWDVLEFPFAFYCCYHPKWQKVRALYFQETKRANEAGEEPSYPFPVDKFTEVDMEVGRIINLGMPVGAAGYYYEMLEDTVEIDGAPALLRMVPDVNSVPDEGYGRTMLFVNPLMYVAPDLPLTFKRVKEEIDTFYASVFPGAEE